MNPFHQQEVPGTEIVNGIVKVSGEVRINGIVKVSGIPKRVLRRQMPCIPRRPPERWAQIGTGKVHWVLLSSCFLLPLISLKLFCRGILLAT